MKPVPVERVGWEAAAFAGVVLTGDFVAGHGENTTDGSCVQRRGAMPGDRGLGAFTTIGAVLEPPLGSPASGTGEALDWVGITDDTLPVAAATEWAATPASGAVVTFSGVVRDHSDGRPGVVGLTYEAYEAEALRRLGEVVAATRSRWPVVERLVLLHRTGALSLSEASVVVVVSSPHRPEAFEAARFAIDTLKETVPIWKREHWEGGSDWAACSHPVRSVQPNPA